MRRVAILGPPGSGKSTLARLIGDALGVPVVHLDRLFWRPGWVKAPPEEFAAEHNRLVQMDGWVIDGNYGATMDARFASADTIVYLDEGALRCTWRILARMWRTRGKARPDLNEGCLERLTWDFVPFVWYTITFNWRKRPKVLSRLEPLSDDARTVVILRGRRGAAWFVASLSPPVVQRSEGSE